MHFLQIHPPFGDEGILLRQLQFEGHDSETVDLGVPKFSFWETHTYPSSFGVPHVFLADKPFIPGSQTATVGFPGSRSQRPGTAEKFASLGVEPQPHPSESPWESCHSSGENT